MGRSGNVQGWGRVSPYVCLRPRKNARKPKVREDSSCLLCSEMQKVPDRALTPDNKTALDQPSLDNKSVATCTISLDEPDPRPAEELPSVCSSASSNCSLVEASKDTDSDKWTAVQKYHREPRQTNTLSSWYQDKSKSAEANIFREFDNLNLKPAIPISESSHKEYLTLNTFAVLPPVKAAVLNERSFSAGRKIKGVLMPPQVKVPSHAPIEDHLYSYAAKKIEHKGERDGLEKIPDLASQQIRMQEAAPLIPPTVPKGPLLQEAERLYWQYSFLPDKNNATVSSMSSKNHTRLSNLGLAHNPQNKRNMRPDDLRAHVAQNLRNLSDAKRRNRAKVTPTSLLSAPILPSLTVTRVEIPICSHRLI
ncbi:uncharacterized protein C16orf46 homolog isoform X2 [Pleurodeles waltl]|uniref:uncharacterized protein C16orf46 homolog isoform X2 n=1 Tax=Pleurodeles waltl TaxID=8319 RepID=UPI003709C477